MDVRTVSGDGGGVSEGRLSGNCDFILATEKAGSSTKRELLVTRLRRRRRHSLDQPIHSSRCLRCLAAALKTSTVG
jgi:hypothetical protein